MQKFQFDVTIEAQSQTQAAAKLKAASVLIQKLSDKELAKLADIVKNDPVKTKMAKAYLGV